MSISANYSQPVQVNGFTCHNCTDVDYAKKHIDPAHPKSGPYGIDAATDPTVRDKSVHGEAVSLGGVLASATAPGSPSRTQPPLVASGALLDTSA